MPKCSAVTKTGAPCRNKALEGGDACCRHASSKTAPVDPSADWDAAMTRAMAKKTAINQTPIKRGVDKRPKAPTNARPDDGKNAAPIKSLDAIIEPMTTAHWARGSLGTAGDVPSRAGGWLGLLRHLAAKELGVDPKLEEFRSSFSKCCIDTSLGEPCKNAAKVGAHVWIRRRGANGRYHYDHDRVYIVPTCSFHNGPEFSQQNNGMRIREGTIVMSMRPKANYSDFYGNEKK